MDQKIAEACSFRIPPDGIAVVNKPYKPQVATIIDIDEQGLTFVYQGRGFAMRDNLAIDLFFAEREAFVFGVQCQVLSDGPEQRKSRFAVGTSRCCRVIFSDLGKEKRAMIMSLI